MTETTNEPLLQALRALRKGDGLTLGSLAMLDGVADIFGTDSVVAIRAAIREAIESEVGDKCVDALANALAMGEHDAPTLMERRELYIKDRHIAMRSLTTYEEFGARVVSQLIEVPLPAAAGETRVGDRMAIVEEISLKLLDTGHLSRQGYQAVHLALADLAELDDDQVDEPTRRRLRTLVGKVAALREPEYASPGDISPVVAGGKQDVDIEHVAGAHA